MMIQQFYGLIHLRIPLDNVDHEFLELLRICGMVDANTLEPCPLHLSNLHKLVKAVLATTSNDDSRFRRETMNSQGE
jgi:hypothetical protein